MAGLMTPRVALAHYAEIELDPAKQKGKGGPPDGQQRMGFQAWGDSSSSNGTGSNTPLWSRTSAQGSGRQKMRHTRPD